MDSNHYADVINGIRKSSIRLYYYLGSLLSIVILTGIITYIYLKNSNIEHENMIVQLEESIVHEKKEYMKSSIEQIIYLVEAYKKSFRELNPKIREEDFDSEFIDYIKPIIRNIRLKNNGYVWVNYILNFKGGDNYAIRLIHPNMQDTEGSFLSTDTVDIEGNKPYLIELEGIKANGELYYEYYFKEMENDNISHKMSYGKLYKPYNWIIATGVYLNSVDLLINSEKEKMDKIHGKQVKISILFSLIIFMLSFVVLYLFEKQISKLIKDFEKRNENYTRELIESRSAAKKANEAKSIFLSSMSHEIRTPLSPIISLSEILLEKSTTPEDTHLLNIVVNSGKTLLELINNILDISKIESGSMELEERAFNLYELFRDIYDLCEIKARTKKIQLILNTDGIQNRNCVGDSVKLKQVILNIVTNAIKFTDVGYVEIKLYETVKDDENSNYLITITDTGIGIPEEKRDSIFDEFKQAESSIMRKYGGTGLGLNISRKIINLMGGKISLFSDLGKGSRFIIELTLKKSNDITEKCSIPAFIPNSTLDKPKKILIVDDSTENQLVLELYLKKYPIIIDIADNGEEGLNKLRLNDYDLVLMDLNMPVLTGCDVIKAIEESEELISKKLKIVSMTAHAFNEEFYSDCLNGFSDKLIKPYTKIDLYKILYKYTPEIFEEKSIYQDIETKKTEEIEIDPLLIDYLPSLVSNFEIQLKELYDLYKSDNYEHLKKLIHTLKGNTGMYGIRALTDCFIEMEDKLINNKILEMDYYLETINRIIKDIKIKYLI